MRSSATWVGVMAVTLAACGGSDGAPGATGATGQGTAGPAGPAGPAGSSTNADGGTSAAARPTHAPQGVSFADIDPTRTRIQGSIFLHKAADESDVTSYAVYYGSSATKKLFLTPIFVAPAGADVSYPIDLDPPPPAATNLIAFSQNAAGEMATGVASPFHDGVPTAVDISAGTGTNSGYAPIAALDAANGKLLVVTDDNSNSDKPSLFRCNLDGTSCTHTDISSGQAAGSGLAPSIAVDAANGKLLVVTDDNSSSDKPSLFRCNLDGTSCTHTDISAGQTTGSGHSPSIAVDATNGKLLVVTEDLSNSTKPSLFRCNLDGSSCSHTDISVAAGTGSGYSPSIAIDALNDKLLVATEDASNAFKLSLFRCNLDGTSCSYVDISSGSGDNSGLTPSLAIDAVNGKLLVATQDYSNGGGPSLFRCNLDGTSCTHTDISAGHANSGQYPSLGIDAVNGKLLVVTGDASNAYKPSLFRCNLDGTSCSAFDLSAGQGAGSGLGARIVVNAATNQFLVVANHGANGHKPGLFLLQ
ncbi:MAG: hypothetical protein ABI183_15315 [Polyangiaceae bacterium]